VTDLTVTFKDKNDTTISTSTRVNSDFVANKIRQFNVSNLDTLVSYALLTGPFSLRINYKCSKYPCYTLVWLNPFGAYDSHDFWMVSKKTITVDKKGITQLPYQINSTGVISYHASGSVYYGSKRDFTATTKTKLSLTSDLLDDDEYTWLAELYSSPEVYIYLTGTGFIPVSVKGDYEVRTYLNSRMKPLELTIEFSDNYNSQLL
jgi:hypothetical protein